MLNNGSKSLLVGITMIVVTVVVADSPAQGTQEADAALIEAACAGKMKAVHYFLDQGACVDAVDSHGRTALMGAAASGHLEIVRFLLNKGADANFQDRQGRNALLWAARGGHPEVVKALLAWGSDPNVNERGGLTALQWACKNRFLEVAKLLVVAGGDLLMRDTKAFAQAMLKRHPEIAGGAPGEKELNWMQIAAFDWACEHCDPEVVGLIVQKGMDVNVRDDNRRTFLIKASIEGRDKIVQILLAAGADVNAKDEYEGAAIQWAARNGHAKVFKLLVDAGAELQAKDEVHRSKPGTPEISHLTTPRYSDRRPNHFRNKQTTRRTPLMEASANGHPDVVKLLLTKGENVNQRDERGLTPLMVASFGKDPKKAKLRPQQGGYHTEKRGSVTRVVAPAGAMYYPDYLKVIEALIAAGADVLATSHDGKNALDYALGIKDLDRVAILLEHGAKFSRRNRAWEALMQASFQGRGQARETSRCSKGSSGPSCKAQHHSLDGRSFQGKYTDTKDTSKRGSRCPRIE